MNDAGSGFESVDKDLSGPQWCKKRSIPFRYLCLLFGGSQATSRTFIAPRGLHLHGTCHRAPCSQVHPNPKDRKARQRNRSQPPSHRSSTTMQTSRASELVACPGSGQMRLDGTHTLTCGPGEPPSPPSLQSICVSLTRSTRSIALARWLDRVLPPAIPGAGDGLDGAQYAEPRRPMVGICGVNSIEWFLADLASLWTGVGSVPLCDQW